MNVHFFIKKLDLWGILLSGMVVFGALVVLGSCARAPIKSPEHALRKAEPPQLGQASDDLPLDSFVRGLEKQKVFLEKGSSREFRFQSRLVTTTQLIESLDGLKKLALESRDFLELWEKVKIDFDFYEVYGEKKFGDVFITGYYDLEVLGRLKPSLLYTQPIYSRPTDLLELDLSQFDAKFSDERKYRGRLEAHQRVDKASQGTLKILPYYTRAEIDGDLRPLKGRAEILCYLDPVDAFLLQVQGSGRVKLLDSRPRDRVMILNYSDKNGQPYVSVGKFLKQLRPELDVDLHVLEKYMRSLTKSELQIFLNQNPSYVFFRQGTAPSITTLGTSAVDGRTIATDAKYFPKGMVGFLISEKAVLSDAQDSLPKGAPDVKWEQFARFVLDQDTGGAILGPGRVDLFFGKSSLAKWQAGLMKRRGQLFYLLKKP